MLLILAIRAQYIAVCYDLHLSLPCFRFYTLSTVTPCTHTFTHPLVTVTCHTLHTHLGPPPCPLIPSPFTAPSPCVFILHSSSPTCHPHPLPSLTPHPHPLIHPSPTLTLTFSPHPPPLTLTSLLHPTSSLRSAFQLLPSMWTLCVSVTRPMSCTTSSVTCSTTLSQSMTWGRSSVRWSQSDVPSHSAAFLKRN